MSTALKRHQAQKAARLQELIDSGACMHPTYRGFEIDGPNCPQCGTPIYVSGKHPPLAA